MGLYLKGEEGLKKIMSPKQINIETNKKIDSTPLTDSERAEYEELKERNKQLEMEVDLLKKLNALVQQRKKQQTKKK